MLVPTEPNIVNLSAVLNRADDRGGCASPRSVAGSARRAARPRGCGGCRPYHCDEREARCSCSSPCCRSWPLAAARPCRRCTVRPSRFTRWRTDRRFSELCTPSRRRRGTEHHVLSPCWDILSRGRRAPPSQLHAMCGSSCIFVYTVLQVVERFREAR